MVENKVTNMKNETKRMEEELIRRENMLANKAREYGLYLFKSRDDVLEYRDVMYSLREDGVIEAEGRSYYEGTGYLSYEPKVEGPFRYMLVKIIENNIFLVGEDGHLEKGRYWNAKVPTVHGLEGVTLHYDLDVINCILLNYGTKLNEPVDYYGLVYSTEKQGVEEFFRQLNILHEYAEQTGIKYKRILGIYNIPDCEDEQSLDVDFDTTIWEHLEDVEDVKPSDVVCHALDGLMCNFDGEFDYPFVEKSVLDEWRVLSAFVNYKTRIPYKESMECKQIVVHEITDYPF